MTVRKGIQAGLPFRMAEWQKWLTRALFERNPETERLRYRRALVGIARKNGKSLLGSSIALKGLMEGGMGAEVYSCAGDKKQAGLVFNEVKWQVENNPALRSELKVFKDVIEHPASSSVYRVISADAEAAQGLNPTLVLFDELHVQKNYDLWDAMTLGSGTRIDPIVIAITTAGYDLVTPCGELYEFGKRLVAGEEEDESFGFFWWEAPEGCSKWDESGWRAANPNLAEGLLDIEDMRAAARGQRESAFRRFRLNQWSRGDEAWVTPEQWQANYSADELDWERPFVVALDMALKRDTAALLVCQPYATTEVLDEAAETDVEGSEAEDEGDEEDYGNRSGLIRQIEKVVVRSWHWKPKHGGSIDVLAIEETIRDLHALGTCLEVLYDPAYFDRSAQILTDDGVNMVEFPQQASRMVPACGDTYEVIASGKLRHGGQPTLTNHVLSAQARPAGEGWRLSKARARRKIDGAIALCMGVHAAIRMVEDPDVSGQVW